MRNGTVKWFDHKKGHGFISPADGTQDVFVHFSTIQLDGYRPLAEGRLVAFESEAGKKGPQATLVTAGA